MNCCACLLLYTLLLSCLRCLWFKSWHEPRSGLRANHFSKQSFQLDSLRDRTRASPMLSPQNQRNRALQRAFQSTTAFSVLASAGALPGAIAPQTPPDEKFLSLNRWRKPSGVLSRNWWWKLLSGNELQIERLSLFFKPFDALEPELFFVMFDTLFDIVLSVTQHAID